MYSAFRHISSIFRKTKPIHLTFFVTRRCNSRCPFCFYLKNIDSPIESEELSLEEIEKISSSLRNLLWLAFSGGEIYLREDLVQISEIFYKNNKPSIMLYPTNGLLPELIKAKTEEILKHCKKSVVVVKLSIDGLNKAHDTLRMTPHSFDKTLKTYHLLERLLSRYPNLELGINTVFCSANQDNMDEIIEFVRGLKGIRTHTISLIRGDLIDERYKKVDYEKYFHGIMRLEHNLKNKVSGIYHFKGGRLKAAQDILQRRLIYRTITENRGQVPCYAGRLNLVLREDGSVYPCEILKDTLGNIKEYGYDMSKVIQSEKAKRVVESIKNNQCFCTHECYFMTNIFFNLRLYPKLIKEYI